MILWFFWWWKSLCSQNAGHQLNTDGRGLASWCNFWRGTDWKGIFLGRAISLLLVEADTCDVMPLALQEDSYLVMITFFLTPADTLGLLKGSNEVRCKSLFSLFALGLPGTYFWLNGLTSWFYSIVESNLFFSTSCIYAGDSWRDPTSVKMMS